MRGPSPYPEEFAWSDGLTGSLTLTYTGGTMAEALKQGGGDGSVRARTAPPSRA